MLEAGEAATSVSLEPSPEDREYHQAAYVS